MEKTRMHIYSAQSLSTLKLNILLLGIVIGWAGGLSFAAFTRSPDAGLDYCPSPVEREQ